MPTFRCMRMTVSLCSKGISEKGGEDMLVDDGESMNKWYQDSILRQLPQTSSYGFGKCERRKER